MEEVILVDAHGRAIGRGEKLDTHLQGKLHRAFSIFIFDSRGRLLIQKRASTKYHSADLWSNSCCSHPKPGEQTMTAARRRLKEEMDIDCELREAFRFTYRVQLDHDYIENEYDHVFVGTFDGAPRPNIVEVDDWQWIEVETLRARMRESPAQYTYWLKLSLDKIAPFASPVYNLSLHDNE